MRVGFLITCDNPNCDAILSMTLPSKVDLSWQWQLLDLALKFPISNLTLKSPRPEWWSFGLYLLNSIQSF